MGETTSLLPSLFPNPRHPYDLVVLLELDDAHSLSASSCRPYIFHVRADDHSFLRRYYDAVFICDLDDVCDRACLVCDFKICNSFSCSCGLPVSINFCPLAETLLCYSEHGNLIKLFLHSRKDLSTDNTVIFVKADSDDTISSPPHASQIR